MPYEYLNNVWGDQNTVKGFGDALNSNLASLVELRSRQQQNDRANALNAAYLALERQKLQMQQPNIESEIANRGALTAEANARTQGYQNSNNQFAQQQSQGDQLAAAVMRRMTAPPVQPMPMQGGPQGMPPTMMPMTPTANAMMPMQPQRQQMPGMPMGAPSLQNAQTVDRAYIQSILARQAAMQPGGALRMMEGNVLRPGEAQFNMATGQKENEVPYQLTPQQIVAEAMKQQGFDMQNRKLDLTAKHYQAQEQNWKDTADPYGLKGNKQEEDTSSSGYTAPNTPKVGEVRQGYRYKGGNPANPSSWEGVR